MDSHFCFVTANAANLIGVHLLLSPSFLSCKEDESIVEFAGATLDAHLLGSAEASCLSSPSRMAPLKSRDAHAT